MGKSINGQALADGQNLANGQVLANGQGLALTGRCNMYFRVNEQRYKNRRVVSPATKAENTTLDMTTQLTLPRGLMWASTGRE